MCRARVSVCVGVGGKGKDFKNSSIVSTFKSQVLGKCQQLDYQLIQY